MKIGIVITHPTQFDVPIFKLGHEFIEVIYTDRKRVTNIYDPEIKQTVKWGDKNLEGYKFDIIPEKEASKWLYRKFKSAQYDLVITNGYANKYYILSIVLGKFFALKNAIRVDSVLYNNKSGAKRIYKQLVYFFLKIFIDHFFVVGTLSKNHLLKYGIKDEKISNYGYISDNDFFSTSLEVPSEQKKELKEVLGISPASKVVLCISKHNEREAPFDTLQAFEKLHDNTLHLLLIGDGPLHQKLIDMAGSLNIKNISFAGYIKFTDLPIYYSISDVFIHDSHDEPWGVSVQEAIACALPVITSDKVGASFDLILEGKNGYVFKAGDVEGLVEKMKLSLVMDKALLAQTNLAILDQWNYKNTLENIVAAVS
ncbi:MAG: glycosyltransferase family 4 protein [Flavipsychrobacter sp.]|nr:glycosyltransferase family 4 protein [Flavipsychrobacter sp.]